MASGENLLPRRLPMEPPRLAPAFREVALIVLTNCATLGKLSVHGQPAAWVREEALRQVQPTVRMLQSGQLGEGLPRHLDDPSNRALLNLALRPAARLGSSSLPDLAQRSVPADRLRTEDSNRAAGPQLARKDNQQASAQHVFAARTDEGPLEPSLAALVPDSPRG